ncbi:MAG TPA: class I SAM-dependent methyltransferase [Gemmatimonadaceae bacterium]|nr:class I SAM-dependent methyltransferase [Gemmatimonadaceae bacterium]
MSQNQLRDRIYERYNSINHGDRAASVRDNLASRAPYLRRVVARHFPKRRDAEILDLGCGYGALIHYAREAGFARARGVDVSPEQVAAAREIGIPNVTQGTLFETIAATRTASCDLVIAFDLIEHLTREELVTLVDEIARVLKDDGSLLIHTPNAESPFFGRIRYGDLTHEQAFTRNSLSQLLLSSGFDRVEFYEDTPVVHGVVSGVRYLIWRVLRAGLKLYVGAETGSFERDAVFTQNLLARAWKR